MLQRPGSPNDVDVFVDSWLTELRAGYTPASERDPHERLCEYLDDTVSADAMAAALSLVRTHTDALLAEQAAGEASWPAVTENDALTAAFASLDAAGVFAREGWGTCTDDGWARAGLELETRHRGVVFFHLQDVVQALRGHSLLVAFDVAGPGRGERAARADVARELLDALAAHGLPASWTGDPDDRVELAPFPWRRRQFTPAPSDARLSTVAWSHAPRSLSLTTPSVAEVAAFYADDYARRTTDATDVVLTTLLDAAWRSLGGERGQATVEGWPHTFVPAGEIVRWVPCDALRNTDPDRAATLRDEARRRRPPPPKPWWRFW